MTQLTAFQSLVSGPKVPSPTEIFETLCCALLVAHGMTQEPDEPIPPEEIQELMGNVLGVELQEGQDAQEVARMVSAHIRGCALCRIEVGLDPQPEVADAE